VSRVQPAEDRTKSTSGRLQGLRRKYGYGSRASDIKNFINGEWVESRSGKAYENRNPANSEELIGMFVSSTEEDADAAVDAAKEAYKTWRLFPAPKRAEILFRAAELLVQRKEEFSKT